MKKTALILMLLTVLSKFLGFGRELSLSYVYGTSCISDAYLIALTVPSVIFGFVSSGILAGYIPMYNRVLSLDDEANAQKFTANLVNITLLICTIVVGISFFCTEHIIKVFASGFTGETLGMATEFTRVTLLSIYFPGLVAIYTGYLQIKGSFIVPALVGIPFNILVIASLFLSVNMGTSMMLWGFVLAMATKWLLLVPYAHSKQYRHQAYLNFKDPHIKSFMFLILPVILGLSVNQINILVDRTLASMIVEGGISALNYANRLTTFAQGIFVVSISTVLYPLISKLALNNKISELKKSLTTAITGINLFMIPSAVGLILFAEPIVSLLFKRGAFDENSVLLTAYPLAFYAIGLVGLGMTDVAFRTFYAFHDTKTPTIFAALGVLVNIILNIILSRYIGIGGLALATSIAALLTAFLLLVGLRKKIGSLGLKKSGISFAKISLAALIMGLFAKVSLSFFMHFTSQNLALLLAIFIAVVVYAVTIYFLRIEGVDELVGNLINRVMRKDHE